MMITGACRCGSVTYKIDGDTPPMVYACHCRDCQTWSGSAFAEHAMLPAGALHVVGETAEYRHGDVAAASVQVGCPRCFTRLYNTNHAIPGMVVLRAGTLSDSDAVVPVAHIWTSRRQPWLELPAGVPAWPQTPTPREFQEAVASE